MTVFPDFAAFEATYKADQPQLVWTSLVADLETPVSAFMKLADERPYSFLLESVEGGAVRGRYSGIGLKPDVIWRAFGSRAEINRQARFDPDAFEPCDKPSLESLSDFIDESRIELPDGITPMAAGLVGYLGYDMVREMEDLPDANPDTIGIPDAVFMRPTVMAVFDSIEDSVTVVTPVRPGADLSAKAAYAQARERLSDIENDFARSLPYRRETVEADAEPPQPVANMTQQQYCEMVEKAKTYIRAGDIFQVVPSQRFELPFKLPPFSLYRSLRRLNPSPFLFFLNFDTFSIVGSSPEILVRLRGDEVTIRPIAGTRRRGKTKAEDAELAADLLSDPKERAEHIMLLDLGRNDVGRVSEIGTVKVTEKFIIENYSHVMHIVSNVVGKLSPTFDALKALIAGFPAGTVSGAPKVRAMEIIDELEPVRRSFYGGAVGYFGAGGEMDTCIALRTALVKDGKMYAQAGGGVVADSQPKAEYEESQNKAKALLRAAEEAIRFAAKR